MRPLHPRPASTHRTASFHDTQAWDRYASRYRPIGIPAVKAGTRKPDPAFEKPTENSKRQLRILLDGFHD